MILSELYMLYDRLLADSNYRVAPYGYSLQKISFKIVLTSDGQLLEIQSEQSQQNGQLKPRQILVPGVQKPSGSGLNPCFLWDNSAYVLGYKANYKNDKEKNRTACSFLAFRDRHLQFEAEIQSDAFSIVCRFLEGWDPDSPQATRHLASLSVKSINGFGVFQIQGDLQFVHETPPIKAWWDKRWEIHGPKWHLPASSAKSMDQCLITGKTATIAQTHLKIKGVRGTKSVGATIAGYNELAYESYGKKQSYNAPVSEEAAFRYVTALNALLDGPKRSKHRLILADMTIAFWTDQPTVTEDIFLPFYTKGSAVVEDEAVQDEGLRKNLHTFLQALRKGGEAREAYGDIEGSALQTSFCMLGLAPNAARIVVRFFLQGTLAELLDNLRRHHHDISLEPDGNYPEFPPAWQLLRQIALPKKEIHSPLTTPLLRAIISGSPYPQELVSAVLRRLYAGASVDYLRACVIKGYLNRNMNMDVSMNLDSDRTDPAYRLGRLFAALEKTQKDALGQSLNKTIRDSYYGAASSTPVIVFPRLLRTYQHHLGKLDGGVRINREKLVQEIMAPLRSFPAHLGLPDQGLFAIGYYHQTRDFYKKRERVQEG